MKLDRLWCTIGESVGLTQTIIRPKSGGPPVNVSIGDRIVMKVWESNTPFSPDPEFRRSQGWDEDYKGEVVDIEREILEDGDVITLSVRIENYGDVGDDRPLMHFRDDEILNLFVLPN